MAPRKRQLRAGSDAAEPSNSDLVTPVSSIPAATVNPHACSSCYSSKICCEFPADAAACVRCAKSGKTCAPQERCPYKWVNSKPPTSAQDVSYSTEQGKQDIQHYPKHSQARKRVNSEAMQLAVHQAKCQHSTQTRVQPTHDRPLDQIPEEDDNELAPILSSTALQSATEFFGVLSNHGPGVESDISESGGEEVININIDDDDDCNNSDIPSSESEDGGITGKIRSGQWQHRGAIKPAQRPANSKKSTTSKGRAVAKSVSLNYDPETCAFDIQCAVCLPDGGNSPFKISSTVTLDELRIAVSEKLHHFPGLVSLRYWLDSDKAKFGATLIQSEEELDLFKMRMRGLIVPQRLPSGKLSTRPLKAVLVFFEDVSTADAKNPSTAGNSNKAAMCSSQKLSSSPSGTLLQNSLLPSVDSHVPPLLRAYAALFVVSVATIVMSSLAAYRIIPSTSPDGLMFW
ncbi:hypothetical protein F5141DRAFT_1217664 [Pisolithus sp. B1]|nr:hypothetical protein F5141DRAFT_1217664 [Pisolithus sp. B1]